MDIKNIISEIDKNGFWFIDIPRTSSSSLKIELQKKFGVIYGKSNLIDERYISEQIIPPHISAVRMKDFLGKEIWDNLFTFSLVRNPWDRTVSMYNYRKKVKNISNGLSFNDYVLELNNKLELNKPSPLFNYFGFYCSNSDYILDDDGNTIVKYVGKYENREKDISNIKKHININDFGILDTQKANIGKHYSEYYNEETKSIIKRLYKLDIEMFEYEF